MLFSKFYEIVSALRPCKHVVNYEFNLNDFGVEHGVRVAQDRLYLTKSSWQGTYTHDIGGLSSTEVVGDQVVRHYSGGKQGFSCRRSSTLTYTCGKETKIISVTEPDYGCRNEIVAEVVCSGDSCKNGNCVYNQTTQEQILAKRQVVVTSYMYISFRFVAKLYTGTTNMCVQSVLVR